jgi:hypothetical protein
MNINDLAKRLLGPRFRGDDAAAENISLFCNPDDFFTRSMVAIAEKAAEFQD